MIFISKPSFSSPSKRGRKGYSLIEMLVSAALLGLIMAGVQKMLSAGLRYLHAVNTGIELQQQCLLSVLWLTRELSESNPRSVKVFNHPDGILFASPRDDEGNHWIDSSGYVRWPKFICYYVEDQNGMKVLKRKEQYMDDPDLHTDPPPLQAPVPFGWQDWLYYRDLEIDPRILARHIKTFSFSGAGPVQVQVGVAKEDMGRKFEVNMMVKVGFKN